MIDSAPKVRGRLPNFGTRAFMTGAHTQRSALEVGVSMATAAAGVNISEIFSKALTNTEKQDSRKENTNKNSSKK